LTFIEQFDYEVVHRPGTKHGNADGLSRRAPEKDDTDEDIDGEDEPLKNEVRIIRGENGEGTSVLVGETLRQQQEEDPEFGEVIKLRLANSEAPNSEDIQTESKLTKKMVMKWEELKLQDGVVYRSKESSKKGEPNFKQLLLPRTQVEEALRQCHASAVAEHFGMRKTMDQVRRRFYWSTLTLRHGSLPC